MFTKLIEYCAEKAKEQPHKRQKFRHYCVVVDKRGRIVGESANSYVVTHPTMHRASRKVGLEKDYLHAEVGALIKSKGKGRTLVVVRIDSKGNLIESSPCPVCSEVIRVSPHIKEVIHS